MVGQTQVPDGWETIRLGDMADVKFSPVDKKTADDELPVELCNYTDVFYNRKIHRGMKFMTATAKPIELVKWELRKGDVLFTKDSETADEIGIPSYVADELPNVLCGYHLGLARPKATKVEGDFLAMALGSDRSRHLFSRIANGVTRFGLTLDATRKLPVLLPPLSEQRAIAEILDSIDESIESAEAVIAATEQVRDSLLHELLTRGMPGWHTEWRDVPGIGTIPASWEVVRLGELALLRKDKIKPDMSDTRPYIGLEHIVSGGSRCAQGVVNDTKSDKTLFWSGDTLYGKLRPNLRKVIRAPFNGACSTDILPIFPTESADGAFLSHLLRSELTYTHAMRDISGTKMPRTSWKHLQSFKFGCPVLTEQRAIAELLDGTDIVIENQRKELETQRSVKASVADALLTGRVRSIRLREDVE